MLKKISVSSLRPGMFLQALDGSWLDHPFWKRSFLLCDADIKKITLSGIGSVVIDTDKGSDDDTQTSVTGRLFAAPNLVTEQPGDSLPLHLVLHKSVSLANWSPMRSNMQSVCSSRRAPR